MCLCEDVQAEVLIFPPENVLLFYSTGIDLSEGAYQECECLSWDEIPVTNKLTFYRDGVHFKYKLNHNNIPKLLDKYQEDIPF